MDVDLSEVESPGDPCHATPTISNMLILFVLFLIIISDYFVNNTIGRFGKKLMNHRIPNTMGYVVLGLLLVVSYTCLMYMKSEGLL